MEFKSTNLCYGDIILLKNVNEAEELRYMSGKGFTEKEFYAQKINEDYNFRNNVGHGKELNLTNLRDMLWVIQPKLSTQFSQNYFEYLARFTKKEEPRRRKSMKETDGSLTQEEIAERLEKYLELKQNEDKVNKNLIEEKKGTTIRYGEDIYIMHYDSQNYIKGCRDISNTEVIGTRCILETRVDARCCFQIWSRFKSKKVGDTIDLDDEVIFQNKMEDQYIDYDDAAVDIKYDFLVESEDPFRPLRYFEDPNCCYQKIFMSNNKTKFWSFQLFKTTKHEIFKDYVQGLDVIYIHNPESKSEICSDISYFDDEVQIFYRQYQGIFQTEKVNLNSLWQIEHICAENFGEYFVSPDNNEDMPTQSKTTRPLKLRHFLTGRLFSLQQGSSTKKTIFNTYLAREKITPKATSEKAVSQRPQHRTSQLLAGKDQSKDGMGVGADSEDSEVSSSSENSSQRREGIYKLFFELVILEEKYVRHKSLVYLKSQNTYLTSIKLGNLDRENVDPVWEAKKTINPLSNKDLDEKKRMLHFKSYDNAMANQNTLIIHKISKDILKDLLYLRSMIPKLLSFISLLKEQTILPEPEKEKSRPYASQNRCCAGNKKKSTEIKYHQFLEISIIFKKLIVYLFGDEVEARDDIWNINEQPSSIRQSYIKGFGFFEMFTDIIFLSEKNLTSTDYYEFWMHQCLQMSHNVFRYSMQKYRPNELYAFQWVTLILDQAMNQYSRKENHARETLTELINNNKDIVETKIDVETISKILQFLIQKKKNWKYVAILSALCICQDRPMINNQKELTRRILDVPEVLKFFLFEVKLDERKEQILLTNQALGLDDINLSDFKIASEFVGDGTQSQLEVEEFFLATISFFADLSYERNNMALKVLQRHYHYEIFLKVFNSREINYRVKQVFCKLFIHLWVDTTPYSKVDFEVNVLNWDQLRDSINIPCSKQEISKFVPIKEFILKFLTTETQMISVRGKEAKAKISFMNTLLLLCTKMLKLGFFEDLLEINTLVTEMKRMLMKSFQKVNTMAIHIKKINKKKFASKIKKKYRGRAGTGMKYDKPTMDLLKKFRVSICKFLEIILMLDNMIKKSLIIFRLKNVISSSIKKDNFVPDTLRMEYEGLSERNKNMLRDAIGGNKKFLTKRNYDQFVKKVGELICDISIKENLISHIKDKEFIFSLLALSFEDDHETKKYSIKLIFKLFSNCERLTVDLNSLTFLRTDTEEMYNELKETKDQLVQALDRMVSFRTVKIKEIYLNIDMPLDEIIDLTVEKKNKKGKRTLDEPETEKLPSRMVKKPKVTEFQKLIIKYSESCISSENKEIMRGIGLLQVLIDILEINSLNADEEDGLATATVDKILFIISLLIKDNEENQLLIQEKFEMFDCYFTGKFPNSNCIFLFRYLICNNKSILYDEEACKSILDHMRIRIHQTRDSIMIAFLYHTIGQFATFNGKAIKRNQNMIFNHFIYDGQNFFYEKLKQNRFTSSLVNFSRDFYKNKKNKVDPSSRLVSLPKNLNMSLSLIHLMNQCNKGSNDYVMNITKEVVTFENIKKLIKYKSPGFIKLILLQFIGRTYMLDIDEIQDYEFEDYLQIFGDMIELLDDVESLNCIGPNQCIQSYYVVSFSDYFDCNEYNDELNFELLKIFKEIFIIGLSFIKENSISSLSKKFQVFVGEMYAKTCRMYKHSPERVQKKIYDILSCINSKTDKTFISRAKEENSDLVKQILTENSRDIQIEDISEENLFLRERGLGFQEDKVDFIVKDMIKKYSKTKQFRSHCAEEFRELVEMIISCEDQNKEYDDSFSIEFDVFVQSISIYLRMIDHQEEKDVIEGLHILQKLLEYTRESDQESNFKKNQSKLVELGIIQTIFRLFEKGSLKAMSHCVELLIEIMRSRNKIAQEAIIKSFCQTYGGRFFKALIYSMSKNVDTIVQIMSEVNDNKMKSILKTDVELDRVDRLGIDMEVSTIDFKMKMMRRVYKFMRLIAEDNESGKEFLRGNFKASSVSSNPAAAAKLARSQQLSIKQSNNIISFSVEVFSLICKKINVKLIGLSIEILKFLLEVVDGPSNWNQNLIIKARFIESMKLIVSIHDDNLEKMKRGFVGRDYEKLQILTGHMLLLLRGLIEGNSRTDDFIHELSKFLTPKFLLKKIREDLKIYFQDRIGVLANLKYLTKKSHYDEKVQNIFNTFFVLKLLYFSKPGLFHISTLDDHEKTLYKYFDEHSGSVEVVFGDNIYTVYHVIHPIFRNFNEDMKKEVMKSVQRDASKKKVEDYFKVMPMIFDNLTYEQKIQKTRHLKKSIYNYVAVSCTILCGVINAIMFVMFKKEVYDGVNSITSTDFDENHISLEILRAVHLVMIILKTILWLIYNGRIEVMKEWRKLFEKLGKNMLKHDKYKEKKAEIQLTTLGFSELSYEQQIKLLRIYAELEDLGTEIGYADYTVFQIMFLLRNSTFSFLLFSLIATIFAFQFKIMFFYSVLLFDVINYDSTLMNVFKSVTLNQNQLILTGILGLQVIYMFTFVGFEVISNDFFMESIGNDQTYQNACQYLHQCFFTITSFGPRSSGGIGDQLTDISYNDLYRYLFRIFYDGLFFIIINVVTMNIVFGVIIDSFAALRDQRNKLIRDQANICFICGLSKSNFDGLNSFQRHITQEHNPWNYMYYVYNVRNKNKKVLRGLEVYVSKMLQEMDTNWVPLGRAKGVKESQNQNLKKKFEKIYETLSDFESRLQGNDKYKLLEAKMEPSSIENKDITPIAKLREHVNSVESAVFNPKNGNQFTTVSHDSTAKIWDLETQKVTATVSGLDSGAWCGTYDKSGGFFYAGTSESNIYLIDPRSKRSSKIPMSNGFGRVKFIDPSPNNKKLLVTGSEKRFEILDLRLPTQRLNTKEISRKVSQCAKYSPEGDFICVSYLRGGFSLYDTTTLKEEVCNIYPISIESSYQMDFKSNNRGQLRIWLGDSDKHLRIYQFDPAKTKFEKLEELKAQGNAIKSLKIIDDQVLVTGCRDGSGKVWGLSDNKYLGMLVGHKDQLVSIDHHPQNPNLLLTASWDLHVNLYDLSQVKEVADGLEIFKF